MGETTSNRRRLRVRGTVQGVGFRPFVHRLAVAHALTGFVRNDSDGVCIEVEGGASALAAFESQLGVQAPPLARVVSIDREDVVALGTLDFRIEESAPVSRSRAMVPADCAPCDDCLRELADPSDRRYRYPFINCTACGPRYTVVSALPYDRASTTMREFALCHRCRSEYEDPDDRRFHAEPTACPACGPSLRLVEEGKTVARGDAALREAARAIAGGRIVAVKGVGGFLVATNASDETAVERLRARKQRPRKPLAVMARDLESIERLAFLSPSSRSALVSSARPIVLAPLRDRRSLPGVAPGLSEIGLMLPSTPLHVLLLAEGPPLQVMTSGNASDEPMAMDDPDAFERLRGIADRWLTHDRPIHTRADDSVVRVVAGGSQPVRMSRGLVPSALPLPVTGPDVLAVGADLKNSICIVRGGEAFVSQHVGDLSSPRALAFFDETIAKLARLLGIAPAIVGHDLHPDYHSTRWALESGLVCEPVQHHHAHIASCLAEHGRFGPAIGVAFDGTGCGVDGTLWGGEILVADLAGFRRIEHLRPLPLPGGEAAIRQPWRVGLAALLGAGADDGALGDVPLERRRTVARMIERGIASPRSTGAGRWFDAIAAIANGAREINYEGQAALELEATAAEGPCDAYPFALERDVSARAAVRAVGGGERPAVIDLRPMVRAVAADVAAGVPPSRISARFHETLARVVVASARRIRDALPIDLVALSGGCFQNRRLTERFVDLLIGDGFEVLIHRRVPPNDGGIALGQAAVATHRAGCRARKG